MNYSESLWNRHEALHERYKNQYECATNFIELIAKIRTASKEYWSMINNALNKKTNITLSTRTTWEIAQVALKETFGVIAQEFAEFTVWVKEKVTKPSRLLIEDFHSKEKDLYNEYKKSLGKYHDSKVSLEKAKNRFHWSAKTAENAMINAKSTQWYLNTTQWDNEKNYSKAQSWLWEAKENEMKYINTVDIANQCRSDSVEKGRKWLNLFNDIDKEMSWKFTGCISSIVEDWKKWTSSISRNLEELSQKQTLVDCDKDIQSFIESNKSNEAPEQKIEFIPYSPVTKEISSSIEKEDLNYEVIKEWKIYLTRIYPKYDWNIEEVKVKIISLTQTIFTPDPDYCFTREQKHEWINYMQQSTENRTTFWKTLNKERVKGNFCRKMKFIHDLKDIINLIWDFAEKEVNYECSRSCIIWSQTFYYEDKDTGGKYTFSTESKIINGFCPRLSGKGKSKHKSKARSRNIRRIVCRTP